MVRKADAQRWEDERSPGDRSENEIWPQRISSSRANTMSDDVTERYIRSCMIESQLIWKIVVPQDG